MSFTSHQGHRGGSQVPQWRKENVSDVLVTLTFACLGDILRDMHKAVGNMCKALTSPEKALMGEQADGGITGHSGVTWREVRRDPRKAFEKLPIFRVSYMKKNSQAKE